MIFGDAGEDGEQDWQSAVEEIEAAIDEATTEAALDDVDEEIDALETVLDDAELPEDVDREDLESDVADLRDAVDDERGPYGEDVVDAIDDLEATIRDTRWTEDGKPDVVTAVTEFLDAAENHVPETFEADSEDVDALADEVAAVAEAVSAAAFDPDDDADTIDALLDLADDLDADLDDAEEWSDLTVREQFAVEGFYDVLESENRKDYPAEWNAVKLYEKLYQDGDDEAIDYILMALENLDSEFMEENILDSLRRIAPPEAFDALEARASKRDRDAIDVLGRIGDERALESLHDFVEGGDVALRKTSLRAIGAIGSEESTQPVANQLADDDDEIRSTAARALGLIGDTRAIDPLADVLAADDVAEVRASAAWALNRIGTERARDVASQYADDRSYIVQVEAQKARDASEGAA